MYMGRKMRKEKKEIETSACSASSVGYCTFFFTFMSVRVHIALTAEVKDSAEVVSFVP